MSFKLRFSETSSLSLKYSVNNEKFGDTSSYAGESVDTRQLPCTCS